MRRLGAWACLFMTMLAAVSAHAETYYVATDGSDANPGTIDEPWSLDKANEAARAGDTIIMLPGTYTGPIEPVASGTATEPLVFEGSTQGAVVVQDTMRFAGRAHLTVRRIHFESVGAAWMTSDPATHHIEIDECSFDQPLGATGTTYTGINMEGDHLTIRHSTFLAWPQGDAIRSGGSHVLIEDNDFSGALAGHGLFGLTSSNVVIRRNYLRNPADRVTSLVWSGDQGRDVLFEDNVVFDCNRDQSRDLGRPDLDDQIGADQCMKFCVSQGIFRNNLVVGANPGKGYDYQAELMIYSWTEEIDRLERLKIYQNTFYGNATRTIGMRSPAYPIHAESNSVVNNVLVHELSDVMWLSPDLPVATYRVQTNLFFRPGSSEVIHFGGDYSVSDAEQQYPELFFGNIAEQPAFANPDALAAAKADLSGATRVRFGDFTLMPGTSGTGAAVPLTVVTEPATDATTIVVDDALFFSDGFGLVDGDEIVIGQDVVTTVTARPDETTLEVAPPVTVTAGEGIHLARFGPSPDVGVLSDGDAGAAGTGGSGGSGGSASGGTAGTGGAATGGGLSTPASHETTPSGGCGCELRRRASRADLWMLLWLALAFSVRRRHR